MARFKTRASAIAALVGLSGFAVAAPVINPGQSAPVGYNVTISGSNVTIVGNGNAVGASETITISTQSAGEALGIITVKVTQASKRVELRIQRGSAGVRTVHSILRDPTSHATGEVWISSLITEEDVGTGDIASNPPVRDGTIIVNRIDTITCKRNVFANITVLPSGQASSGQKGIEFLETLYDTGNPAYIQDGSLYASIDAGPRGIGELNIENTITSLTAVPLVIASQGDVGTISAGAMGLVTFDMSLAEINTFRTTGGGWGGDQTCGLHLVNNPNPPNCTGPLSLGGVLTAKRVRSMALKKNLESTVTVSQTDANDVWRIGRSFKSPGQINLPANGLKHQIIVNQQNVDGVWDNNAPVYVGQTRIQDGYLNSPPQLGNGAVGVARFRLHELAGNVAQGVSVSNGGVDPNSTLEPPPCEYNFNAELELYGQVILSSGSLPAVKVFRAPYDFYNPNAVPQSWVDVSDLFATAHASNLRRIKVSQYREYLPYPQSGYSPRSSFTPDYHYRIELRPGRVHCKDVEGQPEVQTFAMEFLVLDGCRTAFDVNTDGSVNAYDIPAWLAAPTDIDTSGAANDRDLRSLIHGVATWPNPQ